MYIFSKKRIIYLFATIALPVSIFAMKNVNLHTNEIVTTMATPTTSKTIVIDAGHGRRRRWSNKQ